MNLVPHLKALIINLILGLLVVIIPDKYTTEQCLKQWNKQKNEQTVEQNITEYTNKNFQPIGGARYPVEGITLEEN